MTFSQAIASGFQNYVVFNGRATRSAFWYFYLFTALVGVAISVVERAIGSSDVLSGFGIISLIWSLAIILPTLGLMIRRLHDANHTGWWILIAFLPFIGAIVLIIFWATAGTQGDNKYGPPALA
jgi:uncharacterized membrane protein YhaH (DUF805 family)